MLEVLYRKTILKIKAVWFASELLSEHGNDCDIVFYHQARFNPGDARVFNTFITDLTEHEDRLLQRIEKNCRYEIGRAQRDGITCFFYNPDYLVKHPETIRSFVNCYSAFARTKKLKSRAKVGLITEYARHSNLWLSAATMDDEVLVYHAYVADGERTRLWYSASLFREKSESADRNAVGRANRLLHWQDILHFKLCGFTELDWGGFSDREEVKSIADFKRKFGGVTETSFNFLVPHTVLGKAALLMSEFIPWRR